MMVLMYPSMDPPQCHLSLKSNALPITAALCSSDPFFLTSPASLVYRPASMYFLALSQAPPVFEAEMAI